MKDLKKPQNALPALTKYVRVTGNRDGKFVEFDFAINDPTLYVELVLPQQAFQEFCQVNQVIEMTAEQQACNDANEEKWRYGSETTLVGQQRNSFDHEDQY